MTQQNKHKQPQQLRAVGKRKERVLVACNRCKLRKRKCDGNFPCKSCSAVNTTCTFDRHPLVTPTKAIDITLRTNESTKLGHNTEDLERQIVQLQSLIKEKDQQLSLKYQQLETQRQISDIKTSDIKSRDSIPIDSDDHHEKVPEGAFLNTISKLLYRKSSESDEYIGSFAVISIVKAIRKNLMNGVDNTEHSPTILDTAYQDNIYVPPQIEETFFRRFFSLSHNRHYFLDEGWFYGMLASPDSEKTPWDLFAIHIALGIGCRLTELLKVTTYPSPDMYFKKALLYLADANLTTIQQIQACLLIALFIGRSYHLSFYVTSWELTGIAMRKLIQYGFHRKQPITYENALQYEFHKRLFWSAYNYDKLLSLSLGRPGSINEAFIDIPYPLSLEISAHPIEKEIFYLYNLQLQLERDPEFHQDITSFTTLINTCKIRQFESRIHLVFYTVNSYILSADSFDSIVSDIDNWYLTLPSRSEFFESMKGRESYDYLELLYYRARLILFLPKIMSSEERDSSLDQACLSAGGICTSYKNLYRDSVLEFSIVALHTTFLAGVTMAYYLRNKGYPSFMNMQNDIRACSSLLFVFSERWPEAKSYRDLFDGLLDSAELFRRTEEDNSPTSLITNGNTEVLTSRESTTHPIVEANEASNDDLGGTNFSLDEDFWSHILMDINLPGTPMR